MIKLGFWKKIQKLQEIKQGWHHEERQRDLFKERLGDIVEQSASLSAKVAEKLDATRGNEKMAESTFLLSFFPKILYFLSFHQKTELILFLRFFSFFKFFSFYRLFPAILHFLFII